LEGSSLLSEQAEQDAINEDVNKEGAGSLRRASLASKGSFGGSDAGEG